jgi:uncharacterized protein (DUF302 family)/uncharacterized membrane protein YidH (DUF202 family)
MNDTVEDARRADLSDYLAAERTLLAWIRTGLALMGFGFVVARFGIFLQEINATQHISPSQSYGLSLWFGTALIVAGVVVNLGSGWSHVQLIRELDRGGRSFSRGPGQAVTIALFLALVGIAMATYLVSIRNSSHANSINSKEAPVAPRSSNGIISQPSSHSVDKTVEKLQGILQAKGVTLFALIDHSGEAEKAGMKMRPTKLLIFGSPKAGTPLMQAAPSIAIDLPLKILVWEDDLGRVWLSYNSPAYLQERHNVPQELLQNIAVVETLAIKAGE